MLCPYCKGEMEKGFIQSPQMITWSPKRYLFNNPDFHEDIVPLSERSFWKGSSADAFLCRDCGKVIIDASEDAQ